MKKLMIMVISLVLITFNTKAQQGVVLPLVAGDTISTSASLDTVYKYLPVTAGYSVLSLQVVATKISGTVALKAYLLGTVDGTNYILTDSSAAFADQTTNTVVFSKTPPVYAKYQVQIRPSSTATTTQAVKVRLWYLLKKYD